MTDRIDIQGSLAPLPSPGEPRRLLFIDLLRGCACLWVILCHAHASWLNLYRTKPDDSAMTGLTMRFIGIGGKGVDLFIVISGFCLYWPVIQKARRGQDFDPIRFYKRRTTRIMPVYFVAILFALLMIHLPGAPVIASYKKLSDAIPYALMIQNYLPAYTGAINGTLWSVAMECQLYLFFPIVIWSLLRLGTIWTIGLALSFSLISSFAGRAQIELGGVALFSPIGMPVHVIQFVLGMIAAEVINCPKRWHICVAILAAVIVLPPALMSVSMSYASQFGVYGYVLWGVFFAATLILVARLELTGLFRSRFFRPILGVGLISYSIYVVHFPLTLIFAPAAAHHITGPMQGLGLFLLTGLPVILVAGGALYWSVERHFVPRVRRQAIEPPTDRPIVLNVIEPHWASPNHSPIK